jgi:hypothetical protein
MTPVHELLLAAKPYILETMPSFGSDRDPTPQEVEMIEEVIPVFCKSMGITTAEQALSSFFSMAYSNRLPGLDPQAPREVMEGALAKARVEHPELWASAARQLGLAP